MVKRALAVLVLGCAVPQTLGRWPGDAPVTPGDVAVGDTGKLERTYTVVAVGELRTCATSEGRVFCWGDPTGGGLGREVMGSAAVTRPTAVPGVVGVDAMVMGDRHACVLAQGRVACWGDGAQGQLGDGATGTRPAARSVAGVDGAVALTSGRRFTCARLANGWRCWGTLTGGVVRPSALPSFEDAVTLGVGFSHLCGGWRTAAGLRVRCVGDAYQGQLGDADPTPRASPVDFLDAAGAAITDARSLAVGTAGTCVVLADRGAVFCRGEIAAGARRGAVWRIPDPVTDIAVGVGYVCAATDGGGVWCWGNNTAGQLGDGTRDSSDTPVRAVVEAGVGLVEVRGSRGHTCARSTEGRSLWCWGSNRSGQLGAGHTEGVEGAVRVLRP